MDSPSARQGRFNYTTSIKSMPPGLLRLWIPLPVEDEYQLISDLRFEPDLDHRVETDALGNRMAYFEIDSSATPAPFLLTMSFDLVRTERVADANTVGPSLATADLYLGPDRLVPTDGLIAELSAQETSGVEPLLEKARRIYDYVVSTMRYDKSGEGWGRGDALFACDRRAGNCTDFHALLIGMLRAAGIPAQFEIGFSLPTDTTQHEIAGYHCWARFYLDGLGWVPVDASEAWKNPDQYDYFFGAHDAHRVLFSEGRDLMLNPPQAGAPLNYFVYPYAEIDGREFADFDTEFSFVSR